MKLIIDTNRVMAALIKDSYSRKIILSPNIEFISINLSKLEIEKHKEEILEKAGLNENELDFLISKLHERILIIDDWVLKKFMEEAKKIMSKIDDNDTPFIAAAIATNFDIWSDDPHFEKQAKIKIWKTKDLVKLL